MLRVYSSCIADRGPEDVVILRCRITCLITFLQQPHAGACMPSPVRGSQTGGMHLGLPGRPAAHAGAQHASFAACRMAPHMLMSLIEQLLRGYLSPALDVGSLMIAAEQILMLGMTSTQVSVPAGRERQAAGESESMGSRAVQQPAHRLVGPAEAEGAAGPAKAGAPAAEQRQQQPGSCALRDQQRSSCCNSRGAI